VSGPRPCKNAVDVNHEKRPAPYPGPRCATCHRTHKAAQRRRNAERRTERVYGIGPSEYDALYQAQGGVCAICRRATGRTKRLAVDHDHSCCPGPTSCGECARGLLCGPCNQTVGRLRDDPEAFARAAAYLRYPPAAAVLAALRAVEGVPDAG
jgi:hypothetical protein